MGLLSNMSAMANPLFRGLARQTSKTTRQAGKRSLRNFLGTEENVVDKDLAHRIKKDMEMMRRHGINPYDDDF